MSDRLATVLAGYAPAAREAARSTLAGALEYSFTMGENPLVAARTISRQMAGITYTRAATIARTEMAVAGWDGAQADYAADPVVNAWQWMATFDGNACEICTTMHGTEYPTSERLESHPNCRCTMVPVTDNFRPIGAGETGVERMQGMSEADLLRIWGPGRTALIRGGMNPMDLIGYRTHRVFGRQPVLKPLRSLRQGAKSTPRAGTLDEAAIRRASADKAATRRLVLERYGIDFTDIANANWTAEHSAALLRSLERIRARMPGLLSDSPFLRQIRIADDLGMERGGMGHLANYSQGRGVVTFDTAFLRHSLGRQLRYFDMFDEVVTHEIGHAAAARIGVYNVGRSRTDLLSWTMSETRAESIRTRWMALRDKSRVWDTEAAKYSDDFVSSLLKSRAEAEKVLAEWAAHPAQSTNTRVYNKWMRSTTEEERQALYARVNAAKEEVKVTQGVYDMRAAKNYKGEWTPTEYAATNLDEDIAETFAMYLLNPKTLLARSPGRYRLVEEMLTP